MSRIDRAGVKKTLYYLRRNGLKNTCYAIGERLFHRGNAPYQWTPAGEDELERQRAACRSSKPVCTFSIVVPCYRTRREHLLEMIESVRGQTYPFWELILADATEDDSVERTAGAAAKEDPRIRYVRLNENRGIAENTNRGIEAATGDYVGLLDHDDLLTQDALYEIAAAIETAKKAELLPRLLYSDEDKCSGDGRQYYDPNFKEDFNLDLLLSNNYICHFMVIERELIRNLLLRGEYDGAQDYDLVLRTVERLIDRRTAEQEGSIVHVPKVLYHWRCHSSSTAENPQSKLYAYDAGRRAVQGFADRKGWKAKAVDTPHLGFYRLEYSGDPFAVREDVGAIGGPLYQKKKLCGGRLSADGRVFYAGLRQGYSGYLHRASLSQDADAVDIRNLRIREELYELFEKTVGVPWRTAPGEDIFDVSALPEGTDYIAVSLALGRNLHSAGYRVLYLPERAQTL